MTSPTREDALALISRLLEAGGDDADLRREAADMIQDLMVGREAALAAENRKDVETELGLKMAACGMVPLDAICKPGPLDRFSAHAAVREPAHVVELIQRHANTYGRMVAATQSGAREENPEIDDFVLGKSAAFSEMLANIRQTQLREYLGS